MAFAAAQLALSLAVESWLPQVRDPQYAVREQRLLARRAAAPGRPLWVMLGSSRTQLGLQAGQYRGIASAQAPLVFNFGMPGCGPIMQRVCLERLLERGVRPDLLFVEVMPAMLSWRGGQPMEERMLDGSRLSVAELTSLLSYFEQPRRALGRWSAAWLAPAHRRARELRRLVRLDDVGEAPDPAAADHLMDEYGWQCVPCSADAARRRDLILMASNQYDGALAEFELGARPTAALRALIARCRCESIDVTLVLMPEAESFRSLYSAGAEAELQSFLLDLRSEYGAALVDARHWVADEHFSDGHHLSPAGAAAFTVRFQRESLLVAAARTRRF